MTFFTDMLRRQRDNLGIESIAEVRRRLEDEGLTISRQAVHKWFSGESMPAREHVTQVLDAMEFSGAQRARVVTFFLGGR